MGEGRNRQTYTETDGGRDVQTDTKTERREKETDRRIQKQREGRGRQVYTESER